MHDRRVTSARRMTIRCVAIGLVCLCTGISFALTRPAWAQQSAERLQGEALVQALRRGGYVLYFRHAATDWSTQDNVEAVGDWETCDPGRVRQLSDAGRESARRVGEAMRRLRIPVGRVRSSEYCRAAETARLLGVGTVVTTRDLMNLLAEHLMGGRTAVVERARRLFREPPEPGTNTVLVAHGNLMRAATGAYAQEGGAGVFRVEGEEIRLVAEISPQDWAALAERFAASP